MASRTKHFQFMNFLNFLILCGCIWRSSRRPLTKTQWCRKGTCSSECGRFVKVAKAIILPMITLTQHKRKKANIPKGIFYFCKTYMIYLFLNADLVTLNSVFCKGPFFQYMKWPSNEILLVFNICKGRLQKLFMIITLIKDQNDNLCLHTYTDKSSLDNSY